MFCRRSKTPPFRDPWRGAGILPANKRAAGSRPNRQAGRLPYDSWPDARPILEEALHEALSRSARDTGDDGSAPSLPYLVHSSHARFSLENLILILFFEFKFVLG